MQFTILSAISNVETFARGGSVRARRRLNRSYGAAEWRKRKGVARVQLEDGSIRLAELHWYEAHGLGRYEIKIKAFLD